VVLGASGQVAGGTLQFAPGETVKNIPGISYSTNEQVLEVALRNPVYSEITSMPQVWYVSQSATNSGPVFPLVSKGSRWSYHDKAVDLGTSWRSNSFEEVGWSNGLAQLGFGDGDEITKVASNRQATTYFRQTFVVSNLANFTNLSMWLLRDDGGVVYLNGAEVFRSPNLPQPPTNIYFTNLTLGSAAENTIDTATLSTDWLQEGANLVAVEIHQQALNSSDLSFDFALTGNVVVATSAPIITRSPTNQTVMTNGAAVFSVEATGGAPLAYQWWHDNQLVIAPISPVLTLTNVSAADAGNYWVVVVNGDGSATSQVATLFVPDADSDGDGMPNGWEQAHGLNPFFDDARLDLDGDGQSNLVEYYAGTDPQDGTKFLKWESIRRPETTNGVVAITFQAVAGHDYLVQYSDRVRFGTWLDLTNLLVTGTNGTATVFDAGVTNLPRRFYRVRTPAQF
jgi:hypothetical protein